MLQGITILIFALLSIEFGFSQKVMEDRLLAEEIAFFRAENDSMKTRCVIHKISILLEHNQIDERLFKEINRLDNNWVSQEEKGNLYWNISVVCHLLDEHYFYNAYAKRYLDIEGNSTELSLLNFLSVVKRDKVESEKRLEQLESSDSIFCSLRTLINANNHTSKYKVLARYGSLLLPGSGLMIAKETVKGITSLGLNTGTFFAVRYLLQNSLYINAAGWGMNLIQRFYLGGMSLTEKMITKKESKEKAHQAVQAEDALQKVLSKYPLEFRF